MYLTEKATEEGTYIINAAFTDEDDNAVVPDSISWTLTDVVGTVINDRLHEVISPAADVDIVLSGNDLAIGTSGTKRVLTIEAVYDSAAGDDLPLTDEASFDVEDLVHLPD